MIDRLVERAVAADVLAKVGRRQFSERIRQSNEFHVYSYSKKIRNEMRAWETS